MSMLHFFPFQKNNRAGFTLIELLIVVTIIGILSVGSYIPYNYYSQVSRVRISMERIIQSVSNAKTLAQNGSLFPGEDKNANIGLKIEKWARTIDMFAYLTGTSFWEDSNTKGIKTIALEDNVQINTLSESGILVYFTAPNGTMKFYKQDGTELTASGITLDIGWKTATAGSLSRNIHIQK